MDIHLQEMIIPSKLISKSMIKYIYKINKNPYIKEHLKFKISFYYLKKLKKSKINILYKRIINIYERYPLLKYLHIIICDYNENRYIANKMKSYYINGGYTYINSHKIYIYRYQEFSKVVLHEIFHHIYNPSVFYCNDIDLGILDAVNNKFGFNINISETITEFLTTIEQCKFIAKEKGLCFMKLLKQEIKHSLLMSEYILNLKEDNTNLKSYIVLKYILLLDYEKVLENIKNPCEIYKILLNYNLNKIKLKKIKKRMKFRFMINSD
jgi:hypothetical protein